MTFTTLRNRLTTIQSNLSADEVIQWNKLCQKNDVSMAGYFVSAMELKYSDKSEQELQISKEVLLMFHKLICAREFALAALAEFSQLQCSAMELRSKYLGLFIPILNDANYRMIADTTLELTDNYSKGRTYKKTLIAAYHDSLSVESISADIYEDDRHEQLVEMLTIVIERN